MLRIDKNYNYLLLFCAAYFTFCYVIAITWYYSGYFEVYNVFFDTDPNINLASFAHGWGRHALSHGLLEIFTLPIRGIELFFSYLGIVSNKIIFRELVALTISPLFSALTVVYFYKILKQFEIETIDVSIFTLIFAFSFSNLIFAIIPETYAISCFLISLLIYYYLICRKNNKSNPIVWHCMAIALTGITITNVCIFFLVFYVHLLKNEKLNYLNALKRASIHSIAAVFIVFAFYHVSHSLLDVKTGTEGGIDWIAHYISTSIYQIELNAVNLINASANSFVAAYPSTLPNEFCNQSACNSLSFTRHKEDYLWLLIIIILFLISAFMTVKYTKKDHWNELYLISFLVISFNFMLHLFFGREMFMYTQHWIIPLCLVLVPILSGRRMLSMTMLILIILVNINFIFSVDELIGLNSK